MSSVVTVALAIVGVGLVATVLINGVNTSKVITATTGGFATDLGAAMKG